MRRVIEERGFVAPLTDQFLGELVEFECRDPWRYPLRDFLHDLGEPLPTFAKRRYLFSIFYECHGELGYPSFACAKVRISS